ncbi:MAG: hypothetical protein ACREI7_06530, partial [Myxococcota bacterium]
RIPVLGVLVAVVAVVALEEYAQLWLPHRTFSWVDLAWSLAGVAFFGSVAAAWCALRERRRR